MSIESDPESPLINGLAPSGPLSIPRFDDSGHDEATSPAGSDEISAVDAAGPAPGADGGGPFRVVSARDSPPSPAFTHFFQTTVSEFVSTTNISVDCVVTNVTTDDCVGSLAGLDRGCRIVSINGELVSTSVDVKQLLSRLVNEEDAVEVGFLAGATDGDPRTSLRSGTARSDSPDGYAIGGDGDAPGSGSAAKEDQPSPLESAVHRATGGKCIIIMAPPRTYPAGQIEELAAQMGVSTHVVDLSVSIHRRPRQEQMRQNIETALQYGEWLVILNATDSLSTLECLIDVLEKGIEIHRNSRIFITTEPHPHFPVRLMQGAVVFRFNPEAALPSNGSDHTNDSDALSLKDSLTHMHRLRGGGDSMENSTGDLPKPRRKVRINSVLDVIPADHSADNLFSKSQLVPDEPPLNPGGQPIPRAVRSESQGLSGEKFTCLSAVGSKRLVVGSSGGNLYIMRTDGCQELVFHAHPGCVWGVDAMGKNAIATGSEDASVTLWKHDPSCQTPGFSGKILSRFSNDVLCVKFVEENNEDVVCAGGLNGALLFVNAATMTRQVFPTVSTIRAMDRVRNSASGSRIVIAGGTGLVTMWDGELSVPVETFFHHRQQASTVVAAENLVYSGSFDSTIAVSDVRTRQLHHRFKELPGVVSALCLRDHYVAAGSTTELLIFDSRRPHSLLYRRADAWSGMCSGLQLDTSENMMIAIAATSDGNVCFYGC